MSKTCNDCFYLARSWKATKSKSGYTYKCTLVQEGTNPCMIACAAFESEEDIYGQEYNAVVETVVPVVASV